MDMSSPGGHCLFDPDELLKRFNGREVLYEAKSSFAAPHDTTKNFITVVARRPSEA